MHDMTFLQDLAVILAVAGLVTVLFHRLKQPVVLGYILAGFIIGPHTPPFPLVHDEHTIALLAELGVIMLMFGLGQHFSLRKLVRVGPTAVVAALMEIGLVGWLGYEVGRWFGWGAMDCIFLGALMSISSTTIIIKALTELGLTRERFAELIFGILIIEDILGIAMLALLSGIAVTGSLQAGEVGATLGHLGLFLVGTLVIGLLVVPRLLRYISRFQNEEVLLVASLGICFGGALLATKFGYSVALGAFLAGMIVAESRENAQIEKLTTPVRDMFSAVFFVAIGMLIDPKLLAQYWVPIAVVTVGVVVGKIVACSTGAFLAGNDRRTSLRVGMGIAQIGEFSFIIAQLGLTFKVTSDFLYPIVVAVSAITTLLTPFLITNSDAVANGFERVAPKRLLTAMDLYQRWIGGLGSSTGTDPRKKAVRTIVRRLLLQLGLDLTLVLALFVSAAALVGHAPWLDGLPEWTGGQGGVLWLIATLLALPMLAHAFGRLRALSTVVAEVGVKNFASREHMPRVRAVVSLVIMGLGVALTSTLVLLVSITLLPPWPVLAGVVAVLAIATYFMWRNFSRLYGRAEEALSTTLAESEEHREEHQHLTTLLRDASLTTVELVAGSPAVGQLIRELQLRSSTGASVVGIDRAGVSMINPGPDVEFHVGDQVMLLGTRQNLDDARRRLTVSTSP